MIYIKAQSLNEAWRKAFITLFEMGGKTDNQKYFSDELIVFEVDDNDISRFDPLFPMTQKDLDLICDFIISGQHEDEVVHETTKIYHHRMFDEPRSQVEYMVKVLNYDEPMGDAQISLWDKHLDQDFFYSPCTLVLWARRKHDHLEFHTHSHSSDTYKKLLMNLAEFSSFHRYLSQRIDAKVGTYYHIIDSCHIHYEDYDAALALYKQLIKG
jgi:thymidylate synthase